MKFPAFNGNLKFTTVFKTARHWSLSSDRHIKCTPSHLISLRSILILYSHLLLVLPSAFFTSGFPTKILYASHLSNACYMPRPSHPSFT